MIGLAKALVADHGGQVPADMAALVALPGVGRKTANVVLGHALGVPGLPVDRHVLRVAGRLGLIHTDDAVKAEARTERAVAAGALDARLRHAHPARAADLPADAAVCPLPRAPAVRVRRHRRAVAPGAAPGGAQPGAKKAPARRKRGPPRPARRRS